MKRSMKPFLTAILLVLLLGVAGSVFAQDPPRGCCQNTVTGQTIPLLAHSCSELGATWVPVPGPCPGDEQEPTWWDALLSWADGTMLYKPDAEKAAKLLAWLIGFVGLVQTLKKGLEGQGLLGWLLKLLPSKLKDTLAHGYGPMVINFIITGGAVLIGAWQTSGGLTVGAVLRAVIACGGTDLLYRLIRLIFPKGVPVK